MTEEDSIPNSQRETYEMKSSISVTTLVRHDSKESFQNEVVNRRRDQHVTENMVLEEVYTGNTLLISKTPYLIRLIYYLTIRYQSILCAGEACVRDWG